MEKKAEKKDLHTLDLPLEVLWTIMNHLVWTQVIVFGTTCKQIREAAKSHAKSWTRGYLLEIKFTDEFTKKHIDFRLYKDMIRVLDDTEKITPDVEKFLWKINRGRDTTSTIVIPKLTRFNYPQHNYSMGNNEQTSAK